MRYEKEKSQKQTARAFARENRIAALEEALNGKTLLESLLQGEKTWMELTVSARKTLPTGNCSITIFETCKSICWLEAQVLHS